MTSGGKDVAPVVGPVEVGPIAHGGHCVARHEGRVIFVRHALPGERVLVRLTDTGQARFWRGDAVEILRASPDRVAVSCPVAGPGGCGGCDFQHVDLAAQRRLKAAVIREQLARLAGLDLPVEVTEVTHPEVVNGRGWRTRMHWVTDQEGRPGLRGHRSHAVVVPPARDPAESGPNGCELASRRTPSPDTRPWPPHTSIWTAGSTDTQTLRTDTGVRVGADILTEHAAGRAWTVPADGFWQVHPAAADVLTAAVVELLDPQPGERAFDLYCGVGLFTGALSDRGSRVWGVEADALAIRHARANLAGTAARFSVGRVERVLRQLPRHTDLVVLDPPRSGAGRQVVAEVARRTPRAVAYVACDPAALARDLATFGGLGYEPAELRAFDLFPLTHHVECVALLYPGTEGSRHDRRP